MTLNKDDFFTSNPRLKKPRVNIEWTKEWLDEYTRCANDPIYFCENYIKIISLDEGEVLFHPWDFQKKIIKTFHENRFGIAKISRQAGKTTTVSSYILWCILFNDNYQVAILANKHSMSMEILARIKMSYENLPAWLQQGVIEWNKKTIELENGSKIYTGPTSSDAIRGYRLNLLYLDEFAFVPSNIQEQFYTSVYPTITSGKETKLLITSTPQGLDLFYKLWEDAEHGRNDFKTVSADWSDVPNRGNEWREEQIRNIGNLRFEQEFECAFLGSSNTLISGRKLRTLTWIEPDKEDESKSFKYFKPPKKNHKYVISVDTAMGVGLDYSAFVVVDVTKVPYRIVCTFHNNDVHPIVYPKFIHDTAKLYNNAEVLIESNVGEQVGYILHEELEYENIIRTHMKSKKLVATAGFGVKSNIGVRTNRSVKRTGCSTLKSLIENDKLIVNDYNIVHELSNFALKGSTYEADTGNDDLVMCCVLFAWLSTQNYFRDYTDTNVIKDLYEENIAAENELTPFGIVVRGNEEEYESVGGDLWKMA